MGQAVVLRLVVRHLHEPARPRPATRPRVDWAGALAVFATGALLLTALVQGDAAWPGPSAPSLGLLGASPAPAALPSSSSAAPPPEVAVERAGDLPPPPGARLPPWT